mgnify:CR=1 FL=1
MPIGLAGLAAIESVAGVAKPVVKGIQRLVDPALGALKTAASRAGQRLESGKYKGISTAEQRQMLGTSLKEGAHIRPGLTQTAVGPVTGGAALKAGLARLGDRVARAKLGGEMAARSSALAQQQEQADIDLSAKVAKERGEFVGELIDEGAEAAMSAATTAATRIEDKEKERIAINTEQDRKAKELNISVARLNEMSPEDVKKYLAEAAIGGEDWVMPAEETSAAVEGQ